MNAPNAKRLLFVDDEEGVRVSWSRYFSEKGFDVATAPSGEHALSSLAERPADVVVSDYRMPGSDGLQLLEQVHEQHPETPFIILTGYGSEDLASEALRKGAFAYLRKPVDPETLTGMLTSALDFRLHRGTLRPGLVDPKEQAQAVLSAAAALHLPVSALAKAAPAQALAARPAESLATTAATAVTAATAATAAVGAAPLTRARVIEGLRVAGSMLLSPIIGLAFVIFFPVIGFAALFKVVGEALWEMFQNARVKAHREA